jgi:hypothetical protein
MEKVTTVGVSHVFCVKGKIAVTKKVKQLCFLEEKSQNVLPFPEIINLTFLALHCLTTPAKSAVEG